MDIKDNNEATQAEDNSNTEDNSKAELRSNTEGNSLVDDTSLTEKALNEIDFEKELALPEKSVSTENTLNSDDKILTSVEEVSNTDTEKFTSSLEEKNILQVEDTFLKKESVPKEESSIDKEENTTTKSKSNTLEELDTAEKPPKKKKVLPYAIVVIAISALLLLVYLFFFTSTIKVSTEEELFAPPIPTVSEIKQYSFAWNNFWIQKVINSKDELITISFTTSTTSEKLLQELEAKQLIIRDAVYYYLQNAVIENTQKATDKIKKDLMEVINGYCTAGKVDAIGIETLFIQ